MKEYSLLHHNSYGWIELVKLQELKIKFHFGIVNRYIMFQSNPYKKYEGYIKDLNTEINLENCKEINVEGILNEHFILITSPNLFE